MKYYSIFNLTKLVKTNPEAPFIKPITLGDLIKKDSNLLMTPSSIFPSAVSLSISLPVACSSGGNSDTKLLKSSIDLLKVLLTVFSFPITALSTVPLKFIF